VPAAESLAQAIDRAIQFFADAREPQALLWLEYMHRRFGVVEFRGSLSIFDRIIVGNPERAPLMRVLRRIADPDTRLRAGDLDSVTHISDEIIVAALYCDQLELPPEFPGALEKARQAGGYFCTHALLAWIWTEQHGAHLDVPPGFGDALIAANAAIVDDGVATVTDLKLEAAAFLGLADQAARISSDFVDRVIRTQNPDGGWGRTAAEPHRSDWHGTILALLMLLLLREQTAHSADENHY